MKILTYYDQLAQAAGSEDNLRRMFAQAGFNTSTFYRARRDSCMTLKTALVVAQQIVKTTGATAR